MGQLLISYVWPLGNISLETLLIDYGVLFRYSFYLILILNRNINCLS